MDTPGTIFRPGENCSQVANAPRAAILVDGERYFDAFVRATARAERSILIVGWDFDSRTTLTYGANGEPQLVLGDWLNDLVRRNPRLHVRILDWDYPMIFGKGREIPPIYGITWKPHRRIDIRYDDTHPMAGSHHQKLVVSTTAWRSRAGSTSPPSAGTAARTRRATRAVHSSMRPIRRCTT